MLWLWQNREARVNSSPGSRKVNHIGAIKGAANTLVRGDTFQSDCS